MSMLLSGPLLVGELCDDGECSWRVIYYMVLMSMLLSGSLLVGEHVVIESVAGESFITWC